MGHCDRLLELRSLLCRHQTGPRHPRPTVARSATRPVAATGQPRARLPALALRGVRLRAGGCARNLRDGPAQRR